MLFIVTLAAIVPQASALSSIGPDSAEFGGASPITYYLGDTANVNGADRLAVPIYFTTQPTTIVKLTVSYYSGSAKIIFFINGVPATINSGAYGTPGTVAINPSAFSQDPETGKWVAYIYAVKEPGHSSDSSMSRTFRLTTLAPHASQAIIGYSSEQNTNRFAISNRERCDTYDPAHGDIDSGCGKYWDYALPFAPSCSVATGTVATVELYDGDNVTGGFTSIQYENKFEVTVYDTTGSTVPWVTSEESNLASNSTTARFTFKVVQGHKYELRLKNVYANNVLQFKLPYDSINYLTTCPKPRATCDLTTIPARMLVGQQTSFLVRLKLSASYEPPMDGDNPKMTVKITSPTGGVTDYGQVGYSDSGTDASTALTSNPALQYKPIQAGTHTVSWGLSGSNIEEDVSCSKQFDAGFRPFFTVTGGDIMSGGDIRSWNTDSGSYFGAGTNLAAIATGDIQNFVTGFGLSGGAASSNGSALAFANTGAGGTTYGGGYAVMPFTPTIETGSSWTASTLDLGDSALEDGKTYSHDGNLTITGTVPTNKRITVVVRNGSAIMAGNTAYGAYTTPETIPRFTLLVQNGNIYVDSNVTELRGVYYASGTFYSCAAGAAPVAMTSSGAYATCGRKLTVYGAVSAARLMLTRTYGSLIAFGATPAEPAEDFYYSPELWLSSGTHRLTQGGVRYDSYVSLPPIL